MANDRLSLSQIQPSAKPVSSFFRKQAVNPAAPAKPSMLPSASGVQIVQRGNVSNVKGYNSLQELSEAVKLLVPVVDAGLELYASNQYQKGQQELLKANRGNNNAMVQGEKNYAADNRVVHRNNEAAGVLMDELNPYRKAGMLNQASAITATLVPQAFNKAWLENGTELSKLDPGDPAINQLKAKVTNDLANVYGLDEYSPGFIDKVLPKINKEWEQLQNKQFSANVKYKKHVKEIQTADGLEAIMESDASEEDKYKQVAGYLAEAASTSGLNGEASAMTEDAIIRLGKKLQWESVTGANTKAQTLLEQLNRMPSGILGDDGRVLSIGDVYGPRLYVDTDSVASVAYKEYNKGQKNFSASFEETYAKLFYQNRDNPKALKELEKKALDDENFKGLAFTKKLEYINNWNDAIDKKIEGSVDTVSWDKFFTRQEMLIGNDYDSLEERKLFWEKMESVPSRATEKRQQLIDRYQKIRTKKLSSAERSIDKPNLNNTLKLRLEAILEANFPGDMSTGIFRAEMKNEEFDIIDFMAFGELDKTTAEAKIAQALYEKSMIAIRKKAVDLGLDELSIDQQNEAINDAIDTYIGSDLFKAHLGNPVVKEKPQEKINVNEGGDNKEKKQVNVPVDRIYFKASMPVSKERLQQWETVPIYSADETKKIWERVKKGSELPLNLLRGANQNGINPAKLLLQNIDLWEKLNGKPFDWTPSAEERLQLLNEGNQAKGLIDGSLTAVALPGALASASNVLNNIFTGNSIASAPGIFDNRNPIPGARWTQFDLIRFGEPPNKKETPMDKWQRFNPEVGNTRSIG